MEGVTLVQGRERVTNYLFVATAVQLLWPEQRKQLLFILVVLPCRASSAAPA